MAKVWGGKCHRWGFEKRFCGRVLWCVFPTPEFSTPFYCSLILEGIALHGERGIPAAVSSVAVEWAQIRFVAA